LQSPLNNEIIWLSIFQALFENVSDLKSSMLKCLQGRILTPTEFMEPAKLFVFNLLCTVLCNIRRNKGLESQHQSQVSETNHADAKKKIPAGIIMFSLRGGKTIFLPKTLLTAFARTSYHGNYSIFFSIMHLLFSNNMRGKATFSY